MADAERMAIEEVVEKYSVKEQIEEYHHTGTGWQGDDFCVYDEPFDSPDTIFEGATKLPDDSEDSMWEAVQRWCNALSEIRRILPDADWQVHVDDHDIQWDEAGQVYDPFQ